MTAPGWKRTDETRSVEAALHSAGFAEVDAYRANSASIRVRVVDLRFEGLSRWQRVELIEPVLATLPERTQGDIIILHVDTPAERQLSGHGANDV